MVSSGKVQRRRSRGTAVLALTVGLVVLAVSCSSSGFMYVSSSDRNAYFKVPANWKYYDKRDLLVAGGQSLSAATNEQIPWLIAFDADPKPSTDHILDLNAVPAYPVIRAEVQKLSFATRDQLSVKLMRNTPYELDRLSNQNQAQIISYEDVNLPGGFHGIKMVYQLSVRGFGDVSSQNDILWVAQVELVDDSTNLIYDFMVRCESHCYRDNKTLLDEIVNSWTVKER